jgi:hypothetical protein
MAPQVIAEKRRREPGAPNVSYSPTRENQRTGTPTLELL